MATGKQKSRSTQRHREEPLRFSPMPKLSHHQVFTVLASPASRVPVPSQQSKISLELSIIPDCLFLAQINPEIGVQIGTGRKNFFPPLVPTLYQQRVI